jgi:secreted PhoX family phosphatase
MKKIKGRKYSSMLVSNDKGSVRTRAPRSDQLSIKELLELRLSRRQFSTAAIASGISTAMVPGLMTACAREDPPTDRSPGLTFDEVASSASAEDVLPPGYSRQVLISWGDPLFGDAPAFDFANQTAAAAELQFGYNNDYTAYLPIDPSEPRSDHGLLVINHEYPAPWMMWDELQEVTAPVNMSKQQVDVTMAAVGLSVLEVVREDRQWRVVNDSSYTQRISMFTPMEIRGPARGHKRMQTRADPEGKTVVGTNDNCNGGVTPWGSVLSCEEGSADFFKGDYLKAPEPEREHLRRNYYDSQSETGDYGWGRFHRRMDIEYEPNEPNRFDWVVEIDPFEPDSMPVKRTALGRFAHEGAHTVLNPDGRVVVLMGDDWEFEYVYRFVSNGKYDPTNRAANKHLLDDGTLSVARFDEDGTMQWLPLRFGEGPLTTENGFADQGDLLIQTRRAADLLGATPMDAPEGFISHPLTGSVYLALTANRDRTAAQVSAANPRANNEYGHILELFPPGDTKSGVEFAANQYEWSVFVLCGTDQGHLFHPDTAPESRFTDPDNLSVDPLGHLWVCTDAGHGIRDALYVMETEGPNRKLSKRFYLPPLQAECCSPAFTPDGRNLFLSVQHPGEQSNSLSETPTRWPHGNPGQPPRPSVIVITHDDDGLIGT